MLKSVNKERMHVKFKIFEWCQAKFSFNLNSWTGLLLLNGNNWSKAYKAYMDTKSNIWKHQLSFCIVDWPNVVLHIQGLQCITHSICFLSFLFVKHITIHVLLCKDKETKALNYLF